MLSPFCFSQTAPAMTLRQAQPQSPDSSALSPMPPRASLVDATIATLRHQIASGSWEVGDRIPPESRLAEQLNVSRGTIREAVRVLSHAGMLEVRQGDGTYVRRRIDPGECMRRIDRAGLREHLEVRRALEVEAARLAAGRRTEADLSRLHSTLEVRREVAQAPDPDSDIPLQSFVDRDLQFHLTVTDAAHNPVLSELYGLFSESIRRHIVTALRDTALPDPSHDAHLRIVDAITDRDPDRAAAAAAAVITPMIEALDTLLSPIP